MIIDKQRTLATIFCQIDCICALIIDVFVYKHVFYDIRLLQNIHKRRKEIRIRQLPWHNIIRFNIITKYRLQLFFLLFIFLVYRISVPFNFLKFVCIDLTLIFANAAFGWFKLFVGVHFALQCHLFDE